MYSLKAVDLFAGAGGATRGLQDAGFDVVGAIENDEFASQTYCANHASSMLLTADIREVDAERFRTKLGLRKGRLDLLKACPPCQGFSSLAKGAIDQGRNDLVFDALRFVDAFEPKILLLENVPGLRKDARMFRVAANLEEMGYTFRQYVVDAKDFGVPQRRKRLIAFASRRGFGLPPANLTDLLPASFDPRPRTVRDAFEALARSISPEDPQNVYRQSKSDVAARIKAVPVNGTRFDLPAEHQLACHLRLTYDDGRPRRNATSSYGRLRLDEPSPTMTTRCTTPACGSFIHPTEHRGITLREAATLQTFPHRYRFLGHYESVERQIGNAVPVRMAQALGLIAREMLARRPRRIDADTSERAE